MSRPSDIPQDVWDTAEIALKFVPSGNDEAQIASIARAILAAKAEEREACALLADDLRREFGSPTGDAYSNGLWDQGVRIAHAIRKRGEA